ncbi:hypothetical protein EVAR_103875_1 [Eumeta japonica]|uniref:Uncharacterized protein n=1 Tax=Eumeta variegata TaxID=151549 RepID=A0A4C2ADZ3_EUMVA|nr:hypothetical protein EVAR_103875_1 [Eumeta japonica]
MPCSRASEQDNWLRATAATSGALCCCRSYYLIRLNEIRTPWAHVGSSEIIHVSRGNKALSIGSRTNGDSVKENVSLESTVILLYSTYVQVCVNNSHKRRYEKKFKTAETEYGAQKINHNRDALYTRHSEWNENKNSYAADGDKSDKKSIEICHGGKSIFRKTGIGKSEASR